MTYNVFGGMLNLTHLQLNCDLGLHNHMHSAAYC